MCFGGASNFDHRIKIEKARKFSHRLACFMGRAYNLVVEEHSEFGSQ